MLNRISIKISSGNFEKEFSSQGKGKYKNFPSRFASNSFARGRSINITQFFFSLLLLSGGNDVKASRRKMYKNEWKEPMRMSFFHEGRFFRWIWDSWSGRMTFAIILSKTFHFSNPEFYTVSFGIFVSCHPDLFILEREKFRMWKWQSSHCLRHTFTTG